MDIQQHENKPDLGLEVPAEAIKDTKKKKSKGGVKNFNAFITLAIVIVLIIIIGFLVNQYTGVNLFGSSPSKLSGDMAYNPNSYHAIFLSNGQVYFGKITATSADKTVLKDIYYLQVSQPLQQVPPSGEQNQPKLSLVKLGNELHGPMDRMLINNSHILFVEELKSDSKVVEAINSYKEGDSAAKTAPVQK